MISNAASGTKFTTLRALSPISSLQPVIAFRVSIIPFYSSVRGSKGGRPPAAAG